MLVRTTLITLAAVATAWAFEPAGALAQDHDAPWRPSARQVSGEQPVGQSSLPPVDGSSNDSSDAAAGDTSNGRLAPVRAGNGTLPNTHGQVWREYDISPYTLRVTTTKRPELAVIDWVLRETGYEAWHGEPLGVLSADQRTLRVYHTPEMQAVVAELVDRFIGTEAETTAFGLRMVTLDHPNWRAGALKMMRPMQVQTPGARAWVLAREDAAVLLAELRRRTDYREHSSPHLLVSNGQSTIVSATQPRHYTRDLVLRRDVYPGYQLQTGRIDEGFSLEFSPLLSADRQMIDAVIRCNIDQVEKMVPVVVDAPTADAPRGRTSIEVPQMTHFRFEERFRWPVDQVLLVEMGMVALPVAVDAKPRTLVPGVPLPLPKSPPRADLLVFVEAKSRSGRAPSVAGRPQREARDYHGRY